MISTEVVELFRGFFPVSSVLSCFPLCMAAIVADTALTLWRPLLPYWWSILCQTGLSHHLFRSLWRSPLSVRVPGCQKLQMTVWHRCFIAVPVRQQWRQRIKRR